MSFTCYTCHKVFPFTTEKKCPSCGGTNGELESSAQFKEKHEAGVYHDIDPKTGKPTKKKKRR
jgi:hypothetical protein